MNSKSGSVSVGQSVNVTGWATWLYYIEGNNLKGYISWRALEINNNLDSLSKVLAAESPIEEEFQLRKDKEVITKNHEQLLIKKFGNTAAQKIIGGEYWIGMTSEMARYSLGQPDTKNNSVSASSTREQWVYRKEKIYLYFNNYILESYQD